MIKYNLADTTTNNILTFDYVATDLTNPTIIKTESSKSFVLPFSQVNNDIFGYYYQLDKYVNVNTNNTFNPNVRVPYYITINSELNQAGYLQLSSITKEGYNVNLFSDIGGMLRDMSEQSLVDIIPYVPITINKSKVNQIMNTIPSDTTLDTTGSTRYLWWYTFQPTYKGQYDNFISTKLMKDDGTTIEIEESNEHQQRELRTYQQTPGIWYNKLIKSITNKYGIKLDEDFHNNSNPYWANTTVLFPKIFANKVLDTTATISKINPFKYEYSHFNSTSGQNELISATISSTASIVEISDPYSIISNNSIDLTNYPKGQIEVEYEFDIKIKAYMAHSNNMATNGLLYLGPNGNLVPEFMFDVHNVIINSYIDNQVNAYNKDYFQVKPLATDVIPTYPSIVFEAANSSADLYNINIWQYAKFCSATTDTYTNSPKTNTYKVKGKSIIYNNGTQKKINIKVEYKYQTTDMQSGSLFIPHLYQTGNEAYVYWSSDIRIQYEMENLTTNVMTINTPTTVRSNYVIDATNIIPSTIKASDLLINHLKQFGLILYEHPVNGLTISMRDTWYQQYDGVIDDWNNKECADKDYTLEPLNYTSKLYTFNHKEYTISHTTDYASRFGDDIKYGSQEINTGYQFGETDPVSLYDGYFSQPITSQEYGTYIYQNLSYFFRFDQILPCLSNLSTEGKMEKADFGNTIFFRDGYINTNNYQSKYPKDQTEQMPNWYVISDDTSGMTLNQEFYWCYDWRANNGATGTTGTNKVKLTYTGAYLTGYPHCQSLNKAKTHSLDWGKPKQAYYSIGDAEYPSGSTLYQRFYSKWIEDRYDVNTKTYEGYFMLNQTDINNIKFNKFIYFKNQYWCIDKISEYKYGSIEPTKVKLVRVNDINNYINGQNLL